MVVTTKLLRMQLSLLKNILNTCDLEMVRNGQAMLGTLMSKSFINKVTITETRLSTIFADMITPKKQLIEGVVLYLHGGGYVAGDMEYAKGFGTILAGRFGVQVFCPEYRLAPEYKYPCALNDAFDAYKFLLQQGFSSDKIIICGESAGGGMIFALIEKLREQNMSFPRGLIGISPWTDLTFSGLSMEMNKDKDPSLTEARLRYFAESYIVNKTDVDDKYVSPLFCDYTNYPKTLIFVGKDEILLDDSVRVFQKMQEKKVDSEIVVKPDMWHVYLLYGVKETTDDFNKIKKFLLGLLGEKK